MSEELFPVPIIIIIIIHWPLREVQIVRLLQTSSEKQRILTVSLHKREWYYVL